ncbi:MAG: hypothetical protein OXI80_15290 [Caldilineaceae bacterium]|nr:hypothetical protein [Caldilineaceae bacterium]MDE0339034.1 hypothetical protein [Caldilineaceae bacterium]
MTCTQVSHPLDKLFAHFPGLNRAPADLPASTGPPTHSGWYLASNLPAEEKVLDELLSRFGAHMKTDSPFLQAALLMHPYTTPVVSVAVHGLYAEGRVPDVSAGNMAIRLDSSGDVAEHGFRSRRFAALSSDSAASHPDATPVADFEALITWMFDRLVEEHMRALFSRVRAKTKLGMNVMWASLSGGCAETIMGLQRAGRFTIGEALATESALLALAPQPMHDRVSVYPLQSGNHQDLFMRLEVCCQKYLHPDMGKCGYCALRPIPEQRELQQYWFDRRVAELESEARA